MGRGRETLSEWLEAEGIVPGIDSGGGAPDGEWRAIADVARVRGLLVAAAKRREAMSYSELLGELDCRFTRPKMRALCKTLDAIDAAGRAIGEPELAVLVVRESDRLPGQGWWVATAAANDYAGAWTGAEASALVRGLQDRTFDYWQRKE